MSIIQGNAHTSAGGGYQIERSLRFNSADSAYLNRTFGTPTNPDKLTISFWVKRGAISSSQYIWGSNNSGTNDADLYFNASDQLVISSSAGSVNLNLITTQVFRDPSAWYHIVVAIDTAQSTSSDRAKLYVNGVQVTAFGTATYPAQNTDITFNRAYPQFLGCRTNSLGNFFNGYLTEINFIDGQALTPSDFGETDSATGVWKPKAYSGTYGTNGFYLKFADNSGTTSTTLGKDSSGNGNNWTPNNFSVTAGAGNDSLVDTPTAYGTDTGVGGEVRGNYCTWNPLDANKSSSSSTSNGNLDASPGTTGQRSPMGTLGVSSGKWYFEVVETNRFSDGYIGVCSVSTTSTAYPGASADSWTYYGGNGNKVNNGTSSAYGSSYTDNDVIGVALDMDNGKIWFRKNGTWQASGDPVAGTNAAFTNLSGYTVTPITGDDSTTTGGAPTFTLNAGQRPFAYTAPSGFKALCTQNLPTPTIGATSTTQANDYFNAVLYTGTGSSLGVTGVGFQPDWTWIKGRSGATDHGLYDAVRGVQKQLESNTTTAETTETTGLTAFNSDGFTVGALAQLNTSSATYVAWNWKANGAGSSNTAGTITSTVSANTTSGFSIVTYTGNGSSSATVGHGLGVVPGMIILKARNNGSDWEVFHRSLSASNGIKLNTTAAQFAASSVAGGIISTSPTSTTFGFTAGTSNVNNVNENTVTWVAYCFAPVAGYSAFGSYTGNGSTDGPFLYLGFKPKFWMSKRTDSTSSWLIIDGARNTYNVVDDYLIPNASNAEASSNVLDFLSNGVKFRNDTHNDSGATWIYVAFAESPFRYSLAR